MKAINFGKKSGYGVRCMIVDINSKIFINGASTITGFAGGIVAGSAIVMMTGSDIQNNGKWGVENQFKTTTTDDEKYNAVTCTRDMFNNHMSENKSGKVSPEEFITFIDDPVPTPNPSEGGLPIVLNDLDKNPETITFETDRFYAFALIYK